MTAWPDRRILDLFGIDLPILQAPMANFGTPELAIAVSRAGGLGALACASLSVDQAGAAVDQIRAAAPGPINLNFFCHHTPAPDPARALAWRARLASYYGELGLDPEVVPPPGGRAPFDDAFCRLVEARRPEVVSFHFGLPDAALLDRVKAAGAKVISSATTVAEARWLAARGCDAIIAMGLEAGGHRGTFLADRGVVLDMAAQVGTFALVPQIVDAVDLPVIAAGGIGDARGVVAALALGASAVQLGTAYLFSPETQVSAPHRQALAAARDDATVVTNVFTGRPARGLINRLIREVGPLSKEAPDFPLAAAALAPLRAKSDTADFLNLWAGQAAAMGRAEPAGALTTRLAAEALVQLRPA
jgi:nitronate monooxygenase